MLIGKRLRQFRLAKGMSLDALAREMGGIVTKQSLSKYERGASIPSQGVLEKLAETLSVDLESLQRKPTVEIKVLEYRKRSRLSKGEQSRVENLVKHILEERIRLLDMLGEFNQIRALSNPFRVKSLAEAEQVAEQLRNSWNLREDPIPNIVALLENKCIHVIEIEAAESFDGLSLLVRGDDGVSVSAGVVTRLGIPGERQRLSLAHELGHLVMNVAPNIDSEKAAFRFGGAFLAPAKTLFRDVGRHRKFISVQELVLLKRRYGMSIQALLYRLYELDVISAHVYKTWCIMINKKGWRRKEPHSIGTESPEWLYRLVYHAFLNGLLSEGEACRMLSLGQNDQAKVTFIGSREFANMSDIEIQENLERQLKEIETVLGKTHTAVGTP